MSKPTIFDSQEGPGLIGSTGSLYVEKEQTQHGIIKTQVKSEHQGSGFATVGSIPIEKEKTQHGIVMSEEKSQHQGSGFATVGSIHVEKEKTQHGIVRSEEKAQHQGAGFATMGSLATEKELVTHGIIAPGTKIKDGPLDARSDGVQEAIQARLEGKLDRSREQKVRAWLETILHERFQEESLQEALKSGVRLCKALNVVFPGTIQKINEKGLAALQRENISNYLQACASLDFNKSNLYDTNDLYEGRNPVKVVENAHELAIFAKDKPVPQIEQ